MKFKNVACYLFKNVKVQSYIMLNDGDFWGDTMQPKQRSPLSCPLAVDDVRSVNQYDSIISHVLCYLEMYIVLNFECNVCLIHFKNQNISLRCQNCLYK